MLFQGKLVRAARHPPYSQGGQVIHQEAFLLQRLGFEVAALAPSEWIGINRLRCALRRGQRQQDAATDAMSHLANRLAAAHIDACPFSLASKASQVGHAAWCFCTVRTARRDTPDVVL